MCAAISLLYCCVDKQEVLFSSDKERTQSRACSAVMCGCLVNGAPDRSRQFSAQGRGLAPRPGAAGARRDGRSLPSRDVVRTHVAEEESPDRKNKTGNVKLSRRNVYISFF